MLIKTIFEENHFMYIKMQSIYVFLNITKVADFWRKNADFSGTQELCYMIYQFFAFSL